MSEYQSYEFQALHRPLGEADREALRALSGRVRITATSFTNHYQWGDFKGDPRQLMERWFDLHLYVTNWGTRRLMMRLPRRLVERRLLAAFLGKVDWVTVRERDEHLIIDMWRENDEEEYEDWDDGSGWLDALAQRGAAVWAEVETEIARRNAAGYDGAAVPLSDLRAIAAEEGTEADFTRRLAAIRDRHARKQRFLERLNGLEGGRRAG